MKPGDLVLNKQIGDDQIFIRHMEETDGTIMWKYINELSQEKTFVTFQGEEITIEEEEKHVADVLKKIHEHKIVKLLLFVNEELSGICEVGLMGRVHSHVGGLGLSLSKNVRGRGLGRLLIETTVKEATEKLPGLHMIELTVFATNDIAQKLYESCGFKEVGRISEKIKHHGEFVDEIIMIKKV